MNTFDYIKISFKQLFCHPVRTILTVLGIAIGIASMVTVLSVGEAGKNKINAELDKFGVNRVWIYSNDMVYGEGAMTMMDVEVLSTRVKDIDAIAPLSYTSSYIKGELGIVKSDLAGTTDVLDQLEGMDMVEGRFLNESDIQNAKRSVVLSLAVAEELFDGEAVGKTVYISGCAFTVVGVRNDTGFINQFVTSRCYMPIDVFFDLFCTDVVDEITFTCKDLDQIDDINDEAIDVMVERHGITSVKSINMTKELAQANTILDIFTAVLLSIAAVSLIVGGIGIMNIMLITVKERTFEIGIKKALGATDRNISGQFMCESLIYAFLGGVLGVTLGLLFTYMSTFVTGFHADISLLSIALSFAFSTAVGLFFGVVPAVKAGKLDPVVALRS